MTAFCYSIEQIRNLCKDIPFTFDLLAGEFMPGPISVILKNKSNLSNIISLNKSTIALRIPDNDFVLAVLEKYKKPLASSSANLSSQSSLINIEDVVEVFNNKIKYFFDGGICKYQKESTIIDLTDKIPKIIRNGVISKKDIETVLNLKIK